MSALRIGACCALLVLASCGGSRLVGDPEGVPITFRVELDRAFVRAMANRQGRVGLGAGVGIGSGGPRGGLGLGLGLSFTSTRVSLLGGGAAGRADLFRQRISWGDNAFTVPLRPDRTVVLTADVSGAREGWEEVGSFTVDARKPVLLLRLGEAGGRLELVERASSDR